MVFRNTLNEYQNGQTPNPDVYCNKYIKFGHFYRYAKENLSADAIATGHYARTTFGPFLEDFRPEKSTRISILFTILLQSTNSINCFYSSIADVKLLQANDARKDQTFFLSQIPQDALQYTMFPIGQMIKSDVKQLADQIGLTSIAKKRESTGICFIGKRKFSDFMSEYVDPMPGDFVDIDTGHKIGQHQGIHQYTIGQGALISGQKQKYYVVRKMPDHKTIIVASGINHPAMWFDMFFTKHPHWIDKTPFNENRVVAQAMFRFQHGHKLQLCDIVETNGGLLVKLANKVKAICTGQFAVFYKDNECLGSAQISAVGPYERMPNEAIEKEQLLL